MVIRKNVALENEDVECVESLAKRKGLGTRGFSSALRMIIREWFDQEKQHIRITDAGREALELEKRK